MSAKILDGKRIADDLLHNLKAQVDARVAAGKSRPGLAVVLVGSDPASQSYVRNKRRAADKVAVKGYSYSFMTGVLIIDITTDGVTEVPDFVARLRATNRFDDIVYQGYRSADGASYGFFVECVLPIGYVSEGGAE